LQRLGSDATRHYRVRCCVAYSRLIRVVFISKSGWNLAALHLPCHRVVRRWLDKDSRGYYLTFVLGTHHCCTFAATGHQLGISWS
jgi:hypothetical protein